MRAWAALFSVCLPIGLLLGAPVPERRQLVLQADLGRYALGRSVEVLEDPSGRLSFRQVRFQEQSWRPSTHDVLNFSFSHSVFWVRTLVRNPTSREAQLLLDLGFPLHDYVDAFVEQGRGEFRITRTGDRRAFATREIPHKNFLFTADIPAHSERWMYLRFQSYDGLHEVAPLTLWRKAAFVRHTSLSTYVDGLLLGFMLVMLLYNAFLLVSLRDPGYLFYVLFIFSGSLWFFAYQGLAFRLLWPASPTLANVAISVSVCATYAAHLLFARFILETRRVASRIDRVLLFFAGGWILLLVYSTFGSYANTWLIIAPFILLSSLFSIAVGIMRLVDGHRPARYYVLAFLPLILGVPVTVLKLLGRLPSNPFTENTIQFGFAGAVIVFALGLADRINVIREEQQATQAAALIREAEARKVQERAAEELRKMDQLKNAFLANTSHELRTPLNGIIGLAQSLLAGLGRYDEQRISEQLQLIWRSGQRLAYLVNDILDLEKLRGSAVALNRQSVGLRTTVDVVLALMASSENAKGLKLQNEIADSLPPVYVDEARLEQVLHNLVGNAVRYTDHGSVRVGALLVNDTQGVRSMIEVFVEDTGIGIPPEKQAEIFEEFRRLDEGPTRPGGTGLGLSISRRLMRLHESDIEVQSEPGQGARFSFRLPISAESPSLRTEPPLAEEGGPAIDGLFSRSLPAPRPGTGDSVATPDGRVMILLVDDEAVNLEVMRSILELEGYQTRSAQNATEARGHLTAGALPDLVVLDIMMPQVSGLELARELRLQHSLTTLPILMVTARVRTEDLMAALETGANDYLTKPFEREEFLLRVRNLLSLATSQRDAARLERARIVSDLHDHLGATLTDLHFLGESAQGDPEVSAPFADRLRSMVERAIGELRGDLLGLEDLDLLEEDLVGGLHMVLLRRYVEAGREVNFESTREGPDGLTHKLGSGRTVGLYSVVREIVTNDLKYGSGEAEWSLLWTDEKLKIGFRSLSHYRLERHGAGHGTANIVRRLSEIGGSVRMSIIEATEGPSEADTRPISIAISIPLAQRTNIP